ncbi:MAG: hypothetical protein RL297_127 [Pseudomonadota bacterium]|jgi:glycosyltransferase involved in cell wall biosynthesis
MISILIPTLGRELTIEKAIQSAVAFDENMISEIIIGDNSQSKNFRSKIMQCIQQNNDKRIKYIEYEKRQSMASSWNLLLDAATANWVIFLHDDDFLINTIHAEIILKEIKTSNVGFISCLYNVVNNNEKIIGRQKEKSPNQEKSSYIINECPRFVSTIYNKSSLLSVGGWKENLGYFLDMAEMIRLDNQYGSSYLLVTLGNYRIHGENLSDVKFRNDGYEPYVLNFLIYSFKYLTKVEDKAALLNLCAHIISPKIERKIIKHIKNFIKFFINK